MNDDQLLRYSRHILLQEIGIEGQQRLLDAHALLIGAGGLGSPAALYLASAGVGTLTICDGDSVDLTNLQRQIVHREAAVGTNKAESARNTLRGLNPGITVNALPERIDCLCQRVRHALQIARAIDVADEGLRRLDLVADAVEPGGERGGEREVGVGVGAGNAALDAHPRAVDPDHAETGGAVVVAPRKARRRP